MCRVVRSVVLVRTATACFLLAAASLRRPPPAASRTTPTIEARCRHQRLRRLAGQSHRAAHRTTDGCDVEGGNTTDQSMDGEPEARHDRTITPHSTTTRANAVHTNQTAPTRSINSAATDRRAQPIVSLTTIGHHTATHSLTRLLASATRASLGQTLTSVRSRTRERTQADSSQTEPRPQVGAAQCTERLIESSSPSRSLRLLHLRRHE